MKRRGRFRSSVFLTLLLVCLAAIHCVAKIGDIAQGVIIKKDQRGLTLQENPCDGNSAVITFSAPWKERSLGTKKCADNKSYDIFQIEQLAPPTPHPHAEAPHPAVPEAERDERSNAPAAKGEHPHQPPEMTKERK